MLYFSLRARSAIEMLFSYFRSHGMWCTEEENQYLIVEKAEQDYLKFLTTCEGGW